MGDKRTIYIGREKITFDDEISKTLTDEYGITPNLENNEGDNSVTWPWRKGGSSLLFPGDTTLHDERIITPYPAPRLAIPNDRDWERRNVTKEIIKRFIKKFIH